MQYINEKISLLKEKINSTINSVKPFFEKKENKIKFGAVSSIVFLSHALEFYFLNKYIKKEEKNTNSTASYIFSNIFIPIFTMLTRYYFIENLKNKIGSEIREKMTRRYFSNKASTGVEYIKSSEYFSMEDTVSKSPSDLANNFVDLTLGNFSDLLSISMCFYISKKMVSSLKIISSAIGIGLASSYLYHKLSKYYYDKILKLQKTLDDISFKIDNIKQNKEHITYLNGEKKELKTLLEAYKEEEEARHQAITSASINYILDLLNSFCYPAILKFIILKTFEKNLSKTAIDIFSDQVVFSVKTINNLFLKNIKINGDFDITLNKIQEANKKLDEWEEFQNKKPLTILYNSNKGTFELKNISLYKPDNSSDKKLISKIQNSDKSSAIFQDANLILTAGKRYRLNGASGIGKSSLIKAITGNFCYSFGNTIYPCKKDEIYFISQKPFMPKNCTLLEAIIYPLEKDNIDNTVINKINFFLEKLKLKEDLNNLDEHSDNWIDRVSRGQAQKIAIIRALIHEPKIKFLLLDEVTASIDFECTKIIYELINSELKDATVIFITHEENIEKNKSLFLYKDILIKNKNLNLNSNNSKPADSCKIRPEKNS